MNSSLIEIAFSQRLRVAGLIVSPVTSKVGDVRLVVSPSPQVHRQIAFFQAEEPEYISITLDNGAHFWDHEWSSDEQEALAQTFGTIVIGHVEGHGRFTHGRKRYLVDFEGESLTSRDVLSQRKLEAMEKAWSGVEPR